MKSVVVLFLAAVIMCPTVTGAQTRRGASSRRAASAPKVSPAARAAAERIAAQAKNLSNFLYLYGGIVKGIESSEKAAREGGAQATTVAQIKKNKGAVVESIRSVQASLKQMEGDFQADPGLKMYYQHVNGLSEDVGLAADAAAADRFDDAGKRLVEAVGVLLNALLPPAQ